MVEPQVLQQPVVFSQVFLHSQEPLGVMVEILFVIFNGCLQVIKVEQVVFCQVIETHAHHLEVLYSALSGGTLRGSLTS